eukprot:1285754-Amphidinium_carterae.1
MEEICKSIHIPHTAEPNRTYSWNSRSFARKCVSHLENTVLWSQKARLSTRLQTSENTTTWTHGSVSHRE